MTRQYSQTDNLLRRFDRALRICTGATGRPSTGASGSVVEPSTQQALRRSHGALTITAALQSGVSLSSESPSAARQSRRRANNTDTALNEINVAMARANTRPSLLSPGLYIAATAAGAVAALSGDAATRALHADNRRRVARVLSDASSAKTPHSGESDSNEAIDAARVAIENHGHPRSAHSAYEPRLSAPIKKLFDLAESTASKLVEKI